MSFSRVEARPRTAGSASTIDSSVRSPKSSNAAGPPPATASVARSPGGGPARGAAAAGHRGRGPPPGRGSGQRTARVLVHDGVGERAEPGSERAVPAVDRADQLAGEPDAAAGGLLAEREARGSV